MRMQRLAAGIGAAMLALAFLVAVASPAAAHERRNVGPYLFVVGWLSEPAFQGQANAASVRVTDTRHDPPQAVEGLQATLSIEIRSGGLDPYTGELRAVFGQPGLYALDVVPTAAGAYRFRISGRVGDLAVDETFESGPGRFDEVREQTALQYPVAAPVGSDLTDRLGAIERDLGSARALAIVALALTVVALATAVAGRRRSG